MKKIDATKLQVGNAIIHKRYGLCTVREVMMCGTELFGVVVRPDTDEGKRLLAYDSGTDIPDMLEDSARRLTSLAPDAASLRAGDEPGTNRGAGEASR